MNRERRGIALVVVVLLTAVVVVTVLASASVVSLGVRRNTSDEARSYQALLVAESAINAVQATVGSLELEADEFVVGGNGNGGAAFSAYLTGIAQEVSQVGSGTVTFATSVAGDVVTLEAIGTSAGAVSRVLLDFTITEVERIISLNAPAALTSIPRITVSGNATVSGMTDDPNNWVRSLGTVSGTNWGVFDASNPVQNVTLTNAVTGAVQVGEYLRIAGSVFRVEATRDEMPALNTNQLRLAVVPASTVTLTGTLEVLHSPFATTGAVSIPALPATGTKVQIPVTYPGFYRAGDLLRIGGFAFTVFDVVGDNLEVQFGSGENETQYTGDAVSIAEGDIVARSVLGAKTNVTVRTDGGGTVVGGVEENSNMVREDLFEETFGVTMDVIEAAARRAGTFHETWSSVPSQGSNRLVSGITFVNNGAAQNISFCGTGILIVKGNLQTNNAGCPFSGLIYVTGDWDERGNRNLTGAVVVEGLVTCSGEGCVTSVAGTGAGNEDKLRYDPFALYNVALNQIPASLDLDVRSGTWRQR